MSNTCPTPNQRPTGHSPVTSPSHREKTLSADACFEPSAPAIPVAMRVQDFCQRFGIGRTKLYEEARAGALKITKVRGSTLITAADAMAWLQSYRSGRLENDR
jgi:hypothetical protein